MVYKEKIFMRKLIKISMVVMLLSPALLTFAQNNDKPCEENFGTDSVETLKNISMFNQYFQEKKYVEIYPYWTYLFNNAPCVLKRALFNGPFILKQVLVDIKNNQPDSIFKMRLDGIVDTMFMAYETRIKHFGEEGLIKGRWADDMAKLRPKDRLLAIEMFKESIQLLRNESEPATVANMINAAAREVLIKRITEDDLFELVDIVMPIVDYNLANNEDENTLKNWVTAQKNIDNLIEPFLNCDKIVELREPQFESKKGDIAFLKSTLKLLNRGKCVNTDFYLAISEKLFELEPSSEAAMALGKSFARKKEIAKSVTYFNAALDGASDNDKFEIYMTLAKINFRESKYAAARENARQALNINPNSGEAYILIGDMYANSLSSCSGSVLKGREVYWAAVDKYYKAKSVDPSVAEDAQSKINKFSAYFPDKETCFFNNITDGGSYTVGCWIGESTTVRTVVN